MKDFDQIERSIQKLASQKGNDKYSDRYKQLIKIQDAYDRLHREMNNRNEVGMFDQFGHMMIEMITLADQLNIPVRPSMRRALDNQEEQLKKAS